MENHCLKYSKTRMSLKNQYPNSNYHNIYNVNYRLILLNKNKKHTTQCTLDLKDIRHTYNAIRTQRIG